MIPDFKEDGNLPVGIHEATLEEFKKRFAHTIWRNQLYDKLLRLIEDLKTIGCKTVYIDGSYVTTKEVPGDYDACWENIGVDEDALVLNPALTFERRELQEEWYGADVFPARVEEAASGLLFLDFFQVDKATGFRKGIVKIEIG
jgi:hypothetical protein